MDARIGVVAGRRTDRNRGRGTAVRLLQTIVTDLQDVQTVQLVGQAGEESNPVNGTMVVLLPGGLAFKLAVATHDGIEPVMAVGGKRIYAVNPADHTVIADIRLDPDGTITTTGPVAKQTLHPDGTVITENGAASVTMNPDGTFQFHGVSSTFDHPIQAPALAIVAAEGFNGDVTIAGDVTAQGTVTGQTDVLAGAISGKTHVHPENDSGGPTGVPQ